MLKVNNVRFLEKKCPGYIVFSKKKLCILTEKGFWDYRW